MCLSGGCSLTAAKCDDAVFASAVAVLEKALQPGVFPVRLELNATLARKEGYQIQIDEAGARIIGADPAGAFYGAVTFEKLLHEEKGALYLPVTQIEDWPSFPERGLFLEDRYGSEFMTLDDYKEAIDYFAKMKLNSLTIGVYGCWSVQYDNRVAEYLYLPFGKYPQLKTPMSIKYYRPDARDYVCRENLLPTMFEKPFFGDIIRYAAKKNIQVRPLFNSYGHNNLLPREIPEVSAKDTDGKPLEVGFCTSNEKTYEVLFDIYDNIIDNYLASVAWNKDQIDDQQAFYDSYAYALCPDAPELTRRAMEIIGELSVDDRRENPIGKLGYYWTSYKRASKPYPRCWFTELKENIDKAPDLYLPFLTNAQEKAAEALALLEKAPIKEETVKKALMASASHYLIHAECYEILYSLLSGKETNYEQALTHVIERYEALLQITKDARREYTYYHYARDLSIQRELCLNALEQLKKDPTLSLPDTERIGSPTLSMLR